jgi:membrane-associated phospholipid phosphatase
MAGQFAPMQSGRRPIGYSICGVSFKPTMSQFARIVSEIFNPLINPLITFFLLVSAQPSPQPAQNLLWMVLSALFASGLILGYIAYLKQLKVIDSTDLIIREQRISPLTFAVLSYAIGYAALLLCGAPVLVKGLMFCYATNTLAVLLITRWWKISIHTTGIAGPLVALLFQFGPGMLPLFMLIPLVGMARVTMQRHTPLQVIAGGLLGTLMTAFQLYYYFVPA